MKSLKALRGNKKSREFTEGKKLLLNFCWEPCLHFYIPFFFTSSYLLKEPGLNEEGRGNLFGKRAAQGIRS